MCVPSHVCVSHISWESKPSYLSSHCNILPPSFLSSTISVCEYCTDACYSWCLPPLHMSIPSGTYVSCGLLTNSLAHSIRQCMICSMASIQSRPLQPWSSLSTYPVALFSEDSCKLHMLAAILGYRNFDDETWAIQVVQKVILFMFKISCI